MKLENSELNGVGEERDENNKFFTRAVNGRRRCLSQRLDVVGDSTGRFHSLYASFKLKAMHVAFMLRARASSGASSADLEKLQLQHSWEDLSKGLLVVCCDM